MKRAYLDIETTGLSRHYCELTVVGVAFEIGVQMRVVQFVGDQITAEAVVKAVEGVDMLYTYNGSRFDLPFIKARLSVDLKTVCPHTDLMYACWKQNLKGGLKAVERRLDIERKLTDVDGLMAVLLWYDYINNHNNDALRRLLDYNAEDVVNLRQLRLKLNVT